MRRRTSGRGWIAVAVGVAAYVWAAAWFAHLGFNPTDDGLIVSQASRILHGEVPHVDFATPRPAGSPLLHVVDVVLPTPLLLTSRLISLLEVLATAVFTTRFFTGRPFRDWGLIESALVITSFFVSLHTFPLMSWHTIDGLLLVSASFVVLEGACRAGSWRRLVVASLLVGSAPVTKQSFAPALLLAVVLVLWLRWRRGGDLAEAMPTRTVVLSMTAMVIPGLAYLLWVALNGGVAAAASQMLDAPSVDFFAAAGWFDGSWALMIVCGAALLVSIGEVLASPRAPVSVGRGVRRIVALLVPVVCLLLDGAAVIVVVQGRLVLVGNWGQRLWWIAVAAVVVDSAVRRRLDVSGLLVVFLAWMSALSWGYASPDLLAGSLLALVLFRSTGLFLYVVGGAGRVLRAVVGSAAWVIAIVAVVAIVPLRRAHVYRDVPAAQQTASLGGVASSLWGITTNETTANYLEQIRACLDEYPARGLAIVPDSPGVPVLLGHVNPLPVDWWYPLELPKDREWIRDRVRAADEEGDYLVLFQTVAADALPNGVPTPDARTTSVLFDYEGGMANEVFSSLHGEVVTCGQFVGRYRPPG